MAQLEKLRNMSSSRRYEEGTVIVREGDINDAMYIILQGKAAVYKNYLTFDQVHLADLAPGSFFGEMSLFLSKGCRATVVAEDGDVIVLYINRENVFELLSTQSDFTFSMISTLCDRLDKANAW